MHHDFGDTKGFHFIDDLPMEHFEGIGIFETNGFASVENDGVTIYGHSDRKLNGKCDGSVFFGGDLTSDPRPKTVG